MRNLIVLLAIAGSVIACETHGVVDSSYEGSDGSHLTLRQFKEESHFYYSLSASVPARDCSVRELKVIAMGADGHLRVRFEHTPASLTCDT
jgi:hypothetical protein